MPYDEAMSLLIPEKHVPGFKKHAKRVRDLYGGVLDTPFDRHDDYTSFPNYSHKKVFSWMPYKSLKDLERKWHASISLNHNKGVGFHVTSPYEWRPWPSDGRHAEDVKDYLAHLILVSTPPIQYLKQNFTRESYLAFLKGLSIERLHEEVKGNTFRMVLDLKGHPRNDNALYILMSDGKIEDGRDVIEFARRFASYLEDVHVTKKRPIESNALQGRTRRQKLTRP